MIRDACKSDAAAISGIYNHYVENTIVTFEEKVVSVEDMTARIAEVTAGYPWLVFEQDGEISGFAYAAAWKSRCAYRFSAESTVYVAPDHTNRGIGLQLYESLISRLREMNIHSVIGGITQPNPASVKLHERLGFEKVAHFKQVGWKFGAWIDVGYWELILSNTPGR